jgi:DNA-binding beta-propeller fold protein YncE
VWGQYGSFRTDTSNNPIIPSGVSARCTPITLSTPASACTLSQPWSAVADVQGDLYVADTANNRVLEYDGALLKGRLDATKVFGQDGSFDSVEGNLGGVSAASFWHPLGLALDASGQLWVSDYYNMRVLAFPEPERAAEATAGRVLGQADRFVTNGCGLGEARLCGPIGVSFDAAGHALVADGFNNRVLAFFSPPMSLARVDHLVIRRRGTRAVVRWHSTGPIRGFVLYAGRQRLSDRLLFRDRQGYCQAEVPWSAIRAMSVEVVLLSGQEVRVVK